jgi:hypothetical protein
MLKSKGGDLKRRELEHMLTVLSIVQSRAGRVALFRFLVPPRIPKLMRIGFVAR